VLSHCAILDNFLIPRLDKIVISERSFSAFVNSVMPGAYGSITSFVFKALEEAKITPVGLYRSSSEIVKDKYLAKVKAMSLDL